MRSAWARSRARQLGAIILVAAAITPIFNVLTAERTLRSAIQGVVDAVIIGTLVGIYRLFLHDGMLRLRFRRLSFRGDLVLSSAIMLALFLAGRALGQVIMTGEPKRLFTSLTEVHLLYAIPFFAVLVTTVQFVLQMNRMIGANVLGYFAAGIYHQPKPEERVFLFLDLEGSTRLAERLGSATYFELLRRFVDDLTVPVLETRGEIYQYAGDEVVITWPMAAGVESANCIRCFFAIREVIQRDPARYTRDFGVAPRFRGGLHGGAVTAGELGDLKQQIVFVGDILNAAARLEEYAKRSGLDLVVSAALLERLALPEDIEAAPCGELAIRGQQAPMAAYSLVTTPGRVADASWRGASA